MLEEVGIPGEDPCMHRKNPDWDVNSGPSCSKATVKCATMYPQKAMNSSSLFSRRFWSITIETEILLNYILGNKSEKVWKINKVKQQCSSGLWS